MAAAPVMWLKPLQGTANGIFTYMFTYKEALKNSAIRNFTWHGIQGDEFQFTQKHLADATKEYLAMQVDAMNGKLSENKLFLLSKKLRYLPNNYDWGSDPEKLLSKRNQLISTSTMYMFHTLPEEAVALIIMSAQMKSMRAGTDSLWDHYNVQDVVGEDGIVYKDVVWDGYLRGKVRQADGTLRDLTELDSKEISRMYYVYERMHGGYRKDERVRFEYYIWGEVFLQFKRYLPNILKSGFGSKHKNLTWGRYKKLEEEDGVDIYEWTAEVMEGRWKVFFGLMANTFLPLAWQTDGNMNSFDKFMNWMGMKSNEAYKWENLSDGQKTELVDAISTLFMFGMMYAGYLLMFQNADDDDALAKYYRRIMLNFSQHWNFWEITRDMISESAMPASTRQV